MTTAERADGPDTAIVDGIDVDAVASAVRACPGVSDLVDGRFGDATTYLPGRRVAGIAVKGETVKVSVRAKWGVPASDLLDQITAVLVPSLADRRIELVVAEIDDPPPLTSPEPFVPPLGGGAGVRAELDALVERAASTAAGRDRLVPPP
jgi:hypothetical protein